jgi:ssDNA-binding Zn-finger/Zn-ribbon topoisomerase 1
MSRASVVMDQIDRRPGPNASPAEAKACRKLGQLIGECANCKSDVREKDLLNCPNSGIIARWTPKGTLMCTQVTACNKIAKEKKLEQQAAVKAALAAKMAAEVEAAAKAALAAKLAAEVEAAAKAGVEREKAELAEEAANAAALVVAHSQANMAADLEAAAKAALAAKMAAEVEAAAKAGVEREKAELAEGSANAALKYAHSAADKAAG